MSTSNISISTLAQNIVALESAINGVSRHFGGSCTVEVDTMHSEECATVRVEWSGIPFLKQSSLFSVAVRMIGERNEWPEFLTDATYRINDRDVEKDSTNVMKVFVNS